MCKTPTQIPLSIRKSCVLRIDYKKLVNIYVEKLNDKRSKNKL